MNYLQIVDFVCVCQTEISVALKSTLISNILVHGCDFYQIFRDMTPRLNMTFILTGWHVHRKLYQYHWSRFRKYFHQFDSIFICFKISSCCCYFNAFDFMMMCVEKKSSILCRMLFFVVILDSCLQTKNDRSGPFSPLLIHYFLRLQVTAFFLRSSRML